MVDLKFRARSGKFINPAKIKDWIDRKTYIALKIAGFNIMTRAAASIRFAKGASRPGEPPHAHTGLLGRWIRYAVDRSTRTLIVGPKKTNQIFFNGDGQPVKGTVPEALEYGGDIRVLEWFRAGRWQRADLRSKRRIEERPTRLRKVSIRPRPYMGPAYQAEKPNLPALWTNSIN